MKFDPLDDNSVFESEEISEVLPTAVVANPRRLSFIEGMRGLCALYVVLGHICSMIDPSHLAGKPSKLPIWMQTYMGPFGYGHLAVAAFIVISGYCLQLAMVEHGQREPSPILGFFWRRCKRILPPYYGCLALSILVALNVTPLPQAMPFSQYLPVTKENVWAHILMIHNWKPEWMYKINGVLWSIGIEFQLYFFFPLLAKSMRYLGYIVTVLLTLGIAYAVVQELPRGIKLYPWFMCLFALGMTGADMALRHPKWLKNCERFGLLMGLLVFYGTFKQWDNWIVEAIAGPAVCAILMSGTRAEIDRMPNLIGLLGLGSLPLLGSFSYSLYLMHHPLLQILYVFRPSSVDGPFKQLVYMLVFGLPIVLFCSFLFGLVFERKWVVNALNVKDLKPPKRTRLETAEL